MLRCGTETYDVVAVWVCCMVSWVMGHGSCRLCWRARNDLRHWSTSTVYNKSRTLLDRRPLLPRWTDRVQCVIARRLQRLPVTTSQCVLRCQIYSIQDHSRVDCYLDLRPAARFKRDVANLPTMSNDQQWVMWYVWLGASLDLERLYEYKWSCSQFPLAVFPLHVILRRAAPLWTLVCFFASCWVYRPIVYDTILYFIMCLRWHRAVLFTVDPPKQMTKEFSFIVYPRTRPASVGPLW